MIIKNSSAALCRLVVDHSSTVELWRQVFFIQYMHVVRFCGVVGGAGFVVLTSENLCFLGIANVFNLTVFSTFLTK